MRPLNGFVMCGNFLFISFWKHCTWHLEQKRGAKTTMISTSFINIHISHILLLNSSANQQTKCRNQLSLLFFSIFAYYTRYKITRFIFHEDKFWILLLTLWHPNDTNNRWMLICQKKLFHSFEYCTQCYVISQSYNDIVEQNTKYKRKICWQIP